MAAGPTSAISAFSSGYRRRGVGTWLLGQAADWLSLGHVDRLLDYGQDDSPGQEFRLAVGFRELTRTSTRLDQGRSRVTDEQADAALRAWTAPAAADDRRPREPLVAAARPAASVRAGGTVALAP